MCHSTPANTAVYNTVRAFLKDGIAFSSGDVSNAVRSTNPGVRHADVAEEVRALSGTFTYGNRFPGQSEEYVITTRYESFAPGGVFVYHPRSADANLYTFPKLGAPVTKPVVAATVATPAPQAQTTNFEVVAARNNFENGELVRTLSVNVDTDTVTFEEAIELIEDAAEQFNSVDVDDLDELTINGEDFEIEDWQLNLLSLYPDDGSDDEDSLLEDESEPLGSVKVEAQGRLRIPANIVKDIRDNGAVIVEVDESDPNLFHISRF